ncbi:hypothetical protein ACFFSY_00705 [Paenibacillus aurantiacus]|uniref:Tyrosine protein kinase n=1 Tax=Paenibacillus aurantiacus TaxID=1936118 RepID=A0ABV5KGV9_9BACL
MKYRNDPSVSGFQQPFGGQSPYPGISDPFLQAPGLGGPPTPFSPSLETNIPPIAVKPADAAIPAEAVSEALESATPAATKASGFSLASLGGNIKDLQGLVDRMGGLDGILSTVQKVQKVVSSVQQMAPLIKVLAGSIGKKGAAATTATLDEEAFETATPKRKKSRKRARGKSKPLAGGGPRPRPRR